MWHADEAELPEIRVALATEASIRNDITWSSTRVRPSTWARSIRQYTRLYLAAAAHLCALWIAECPRETLRDRLLVGRPTR